MLIKRKTCKSKYASREECTDKLTNVALTKSIPNCYCSHAFKETDYFVSFKRVMDHDNNSWAFEFYSNGAVQRVRVLPDYAAVQFLSALGGTLGLGAKLVTILQLFLFLLI